MAKILKNLFPDQAHYLAYYVPIISVVPATLPSLVTVKDYVSIWDPCRPQELWWIQTQGCSRPLYKMVQCLNVTLCVSSSAL